MGVQSNLLNTPTYVLLAPVYPPKEENRFIAIETTKMTVTFFWKVSF